MSTNTFEVKANGVVSSSSPVAPITVHVKQPSSTDVVLDVLFSGICHSDVHQARDEWGGSIFPMVPGHEIVGRVSRVGADVKSLKVGDLVGVGCMRQSCRKCSTCKHDEEQFCKKREWTYNSRAPDGSINFGGYAQQMVVDEYFVMPLPAGLHGNLAAVAPLLCAGITVFSPIYRYNVKPGTRMAVVGLGGLGHMAVKFGVAFGAKVTVISSSPSKRADALKLGAHEFLVSTDKDAMKAAAESFDFIVNTLSAKHEFGPYLELLAIGGTMCVVGLPPAAPVSAGPLIMGRRSIVGSLIGGIAETKTMLDLCADKKIFCEIELIKAAEIPKAWERMMAADVRYRFVIDGATIGH